jgi:hypothetical protein
MSYQTEKAYADWIKRFIIFHNKRHPKEMGAREIRDFLAHLVNDRDVAPSTQNQALHSLLFLYREVLQIDLVFFRPDKERNSGVHALEETPSIPMSPSLVIVAD